VYNTRARLFSSDHIGGFELVNITGSVVSVLQVTGLFELVNTAGSVVSVLKVAGSESHFTSPILLTTIIFRICSLIFPA
jgi:hypothetical protein